MNKEEKKVGNSGREGNKGGEKEKYEGEKKKGRMGRKMKEENERVTVGGEDYED